MEADNTNIERLNSLLADYNADDRELVSKTYGIAEKRLEGKMRGNGHPFIEHPVGVAGIVANDMKLMPSAVMAVFLHEAYRDAVAGNASVTDAGKDSRSADSRMNVEEELKNQGWSQEVINIVTGLNNISKITPKDTGLQAERYRKLIISYSTDPRVTLIKIADRLEIMRNMHVFPKSSISRKITETATLYIPIAHQLGLYNIKSELEDLYFRYANPQDYRTITNKLKATEESRERLAREFVKPLDEVLSKKYKYKLKVRTKTAYSIWKKMQAQGVPFEGVYDVFAIRFIVEAPPEKEKDYCWDIFSEVTKEYEQDVKRLRDWLTKPKPNGYESLHITVKNKEGYPIEVQIRTERMDQVAENGHASHWSYKGVKSSNTLSDWLSSVKEMLENPGDGSSYTSKDLSLNEIFCFTPNGDLLQLPKGATVLDFAFHIHTNLGVKCSGGKVNGRIMSIRDELHTGDIVEILSNKNQKPSADWLNFVNSSKAKSRIKAKLKEEETKQSRLGREILERRLKNWKMELTDELLSDLTKHFGFKAISEFCISVYNSKTDTSRIKEYIESQQSEDSSSSTGDSSTTSSASKEDSGRKGVESAGGSDFLVINDNLSNLQFKMAKCCNPIFGDDVFGFVSALGGIKIHRINCPNAARLLEQYPYRVIHKVRWRQVSTTTSFQVSLKVIAEEEAASSGTIFDTITKQNAKVRSYRIEERGGKSAYLANVLIAISVSNNGHLDKVISELKKLKGVKNVLRVGINK